MAINMIEILLVLTVLVNSVSCTCRPRCGKDAVCTISGCKCSPSKPLGNPLFWCHDSSESSCISIGDPRMEGFSKALLHIYYLCKFTYASFDTFLGGQPRSTRDVTEQLPKFGSFCITEPVNNRCRVVVYAVNGLSRRGVYYVRAAELQLQIKYGLKVESLTIVIEENKASYKLNKGGKRVIESSLKIKINNQDVSVTYDLQSRLWIISIPACAGTIMAFRSWLQGVENQNPRDGLSLITRTTDIITTHHDCSFPIVLCDRPSGNQTVYDDYRKKEGFSSLNAAVIYALLSHPPIYGQLSNNLECSNLVAHSKSCDDRLLKKAAKVCNIIFTSYAGCLQEHARPVTSTFQECLDGVCYQDQSLCDRAYSKVTSSCGQVPKFTCI